MLNCTTLKIYTRTGDDGTTGLRGNRRTPKSDPRIAAYGAIDEANSVLGVALSHDMDADLSAMITQIQGELFVAGADLSNPDMNDGKNRVTGTMVENLEALIDGLECELEPLTNFILPGGDGAAAMVHLARTVIRRAETHVAMLDAKETNPHCMAYINRLADLLFVLGRTCNRRKGHPETVWNP